MNTDDPRFELIRRTSDGEASAQELAQVDSLLREDAGFRHAYVRYINLDMALDTVAKTMPQPQRDVTPTNPMRNAFFSWRQLTTAAAGVVLGMFCTSMVFGYVGSRAAQKVKSVFYEGFESSVTKTQPGLPGEEGHWSGDEAAVVPATTRVKAHSGLKMLRFLNATYPGEKSPRSQWGDVYRLVDVRGLAGEGKTVARVSASFAQDTLSPEERFAGRVEALAIDKELNALPIPLPLAWLQQNNSATSSRRALLSTVGAWQDVSVEVPITRETRYVMLHLAIVQEQPIIQSGAVQFPGHFMDDVKLEVIDRP